MTTRISNAACLAMLDALVDLLDGGAGAGYIEIRTGSAPTNVDAAATGTLLATLTLSDPAFGAAADQNPGGRATANSITGDSSADATGTAGYFRAFDSNNAVVIQGDITGTGGGGDMELDNTSIAAGQQVNMTAWTVDLSEVGA